MHLESLIRRLGFAASTPPSPTPVAQGAPLSASSALTFPRGPVGGSRLTPDFIAAIGRFAYFWAWPLVNIYNRYWTQGWVKTQTFLVGGVAPVAPINRLGMLVDYNDPGQRFITCPSQDLIYGFGILDLGREPVVVQVPDFGKRFFVFQATDQRTDGFADIGSMYGDQARLLFTCRTRLARQSAPGCTRHVPRLDQYRVHHPPRVPGGRSRRQGGGPARHSPDHGLSRLRGRWDDEGKELDRHHPPALEKAEQ